MAKRKAKCGKGWTILEIRRDGKTERVCARFIRPKIKSKGMTWKDWVLLPVQVIGGGGAHW